MELEGKVKYVGPEQQVTATFKKRELVITTEEQYPQHILIEFAQDKCEYLDGYKIGDPVKVFINLRGREWVNPQGETKYFNQISGWQISKRVIHGPAPQAQTQTNPTEMGGPLPGEEVDDDPLPF